MPVKSRNARSIADDMARSLACTLLMTAGAVSLIGCGSDAGSSLSRDTVEALQGTWERRGYGDAIRIEGATVTTYEFTTTSCLLADIGSLEEIDEAVLSDDESEFQVKDAPVSFADHFYRMDSLPASCEVPVGNSPTDVHDHLWSTFNEYYAFFAERDVDWLTRYDVTRQSLRPDMTDDELFDVLATMIEPIDDQHVGLASPERSFDPGQPKGFLATLRREFESQADGTDLEAFIAGEFALWESIVQSAYLGGDVEQAGGPFDDLFTWGIIDDAVGYLRIDLMILDVEQPVSAQVSQLDRILDEALQDLATTRALILDIRMNPGGTDPVAFAIARRFTDTERLAVSKFSRSVSGQGPMQSIYLAPVDRPSYLNPVVLITSALTTSGAEVFTLAMRSLPQVTHMGEPTSGALSDVLEKSLPNGWTFELANEVYLDANGVSYEGAGIPPHLDSPVFDRTVRHAGGDSAIDAALMHLGIGQ